MAADTLDLPSLNELWRRVASRYRSCGQFTRRYVRSKLRRDPVHAAILDLARVEPLGHVIDLGCGRGQLAVALLEAGLARSVNGLDWDRRLIADAQAAGLSLPANFGCGDVVTTDFPPCDSVLLVDLLYQLPGSQQLDVLARAAQAARDRVIIRTFDPDRGWRSFAGWTMEHILRACGRYRPAAIRPLPIDVLADTLATHGFQTGAQPCWGPTPLPNVLLIGRRGAVTNI